MEKLTLPEKLTIYNVGSYREEILDLLSTESDINLDCSQLQEIDAAGVQLLLSLEKTTFREEFEVQFTNLTKEGRDVLEIAGVKELLMGGEKNDE